VFGALGWKVTQASAEGRNRQEKLSANHQKLIVKDRRAFSSLGRNDYIYYLFA
jgi:hypothetical protein